MNRRLICSRGCTLKADRRPIYLLSKDNNSNDNNNNNNNNDNDNDNDNDNLSS